MSEIISTTITWTFLSFLPVIFANSLDQVQARLTSMDVIVSHIQGRLLARAVILINCVLFINGSSLMEEKSEVSFLIGQSLMFGKEVNSVLHIRCVRLNVNNVHYAHASFKGQGWGCLILFI